MCVWVCVCVYVGVCVCPFAIDNFAKLAVEFNDEDINNYPSIIKDHIARHDRYQDAATTNVPAVLFYLVDKKDCTFGDLECLLKEASPRNALKVAGVLWYVSLCVALAISTKARFIL